MSANDGFSIKDSVGVGVSRGRTIEEKAGFKGVFTCELLRAKRDIFGMAIPGEFEEPEQIVINNTATVVGINSILGVQFHGDTQITTWYGGLVDNAAFSAFSTADTMGSHAGWAESVAYSDATRITWGAGAASAGSITNASAMTFNINTTATIKGLFITSVSTKSGTTGTLWATAAFGSTVSVSNGDQLRVTYTLSAS